MISKGIRYLVLVSFLGWTANGEVLRGTISFPKESPVFTFEIPKRCGAGFDAKGVLTIRTNEGHYFLLSEMSAHDKESARKEMEKLSPYPCAAKGAMDVKPVSAHETMFNANITGLETTCSGEIYAGLDKVPLDELSAVAFSLDGKRFFRLSDYSSKDFAIVQQIEESIKAASPGPSPTAGR